MTADVQPMQLHEGLPEGLLQNRCKACKLTPSAWICAADQAAYLTQTPVAHCPIGSSTVIRGGAETLAQLPAGSQGGDNTQRWNRTGNVDGRIHIHNNRRLGDIDEPR
jgi:hypothetical protein